MFFEFFNKTPDYKGQAEENERKRQINIRMGLRGIDKAFSGYNDDWYNTYQNAIVAASLPNLSAQYRATRDPIGFNIANRGLIGSSVGSKAWRDLEMAMQSAKGEVSNAAITAAQQQRQAVESAKDRQINFLYQSVDPAQAISRSTATAATMRTPSVAAASINAFAGLLNQYYMNQVLNNYRSTAPAITPQPTNISSQLPVPAISGGQ